MGPGETFLGRTSLPGQGTAKQHPPREKGPFIGAGLE